MPVLVHGVQSMQGLKPAKEFRTLIANEESLDALLTVKPRIGAFLLPDERNDQRACAIAMMSTTNAGTVAGTIGWTL